MKTVTTTTNVYKLHELSEEAQDKAIRNLSTINVDYEWWLATFEDAEAVGLKIESFGLDRNLGAKGHLTLPAEDVAITISNRHGEGCETYDIARQFLEDHGPIFADYMDEEGENYESSELGDRMMELESEFEADLISEYAHMLQREYDYLTSEEAIRETIEANDYDFTEDGKLF